MPDVNAGRVALFDGLAAMAEAGERAVAIEGRPPKASHGATLPTLADLGFSSACASRWQTAGELPADLLEARKQQILDAARPVFFFSLSQSPACASITSDRKAADFPKSEPRD